MIEKTYPPPGKGIVDKILSYVPGYKEKEKALAIGITVEEFVKRDTIVKKLFSDCQWKLGDKLYPIYQKDFDNYGQLIVIGIYKSYNDYTISEAKEWPKDDQPMILTVRSEKKPGTIVCCGAGYLKKEAPVCQC